MDRQSAEHPTTVVVGLGNELLCDEGVGIHVLGELEKRSLPTGTTLIDAGTAVDTLWDELVAVDRLIIVDAVEGGGAPGSVYQYRYDECPETRRARLSGHEVGLRDKLASLGLMGCDLPEVVVIGIEPERIEWGIRLSPQVQERLTAVVDLVLAEISRSPVDTTLSV